MKKITIVSLFLLFAISVFTKRALSAMPKTEASLWPLHEQGPPEPWLLA